MAAKKSLSRKTKKKGTNQSPAGGPTPLSTKIAKVVIFFMENHTTDNIASDVAGVNGNNALPLSADVVVPDPSHDHGHWAQGRHRRPEVRVANGFLQRNYRTCTS